MITSDDDNIEHEQLEARQLFSEHFALRSPVVIMKIAQQLTRAV